MGIRTPETGLGDEMFLNQFSARVPEGNEKPSGYVEIRHGTKYTIMLHNYRNVRCNAKVVVDGKDVGTFRLSAGDKIRLERPVHDDGCFTAYTKGSEDATRAGEADIDESVKGLISVTFIPEKYRRKMWQWRSHSYYPVPDPLYDPYGSDWYRGMTWTSESTDVSCDCEYAYADLGRGNTVSRSSYSAEASASADQKYNGMITGLSGRSNQMFVDVPYMELDYSQQTTIHLRLVEPKVDDGPRPLTSMSNPVPPPII